VLPQERHQGLDFGKLRHISSLAPRRC
jgi:hypothetical protein